MTGVFEGKNLMLIMLESIDTWMINEDYMPELYSLQQKSINFTRHYTPLFINAGTFNTEFAALTGLLTPNPGLEKLTRPTISHGPRQVCSEKCILHHLTADPIIYA